MKSYSWYFGAIGRTEATDLLMAEREGGVFLVRDSATSVGDYVLCVKYVFYFSEGLEVIDVYYYFREDSKVSHYIINKTQQQKDQSRYKIGDNFFNNLPELLSFYKVHYLDTTPLIRPASKKVEKVIAKFDFEGKVSVCFSHFIN